MQIFHKYLLYLFDDSAGLSYVQNGDYDVTEQETEERVAGKWKMIVKPGASLVMSALLRQIVPDEDLQRRECPTCKRVNEVQDESRKSTTWYVVPSWPAYSCATEARKVDIATPLLNTTRLMRSCLSLRIPMTIQYTKPHLPPRAILPTTPRQVVNVMGMILMQGIVSSFAVSWFCNNYMPPRSFRWNLKPGCLCRFQRYRCEFIGILTAHV